MTRDKEKVTIQSRGMVSSVPSMLLRAAQRPDDTYCFRNAKTEWAHGLDCFISPFGHCEWTKSISGLTQKENYVGPNYSQEWECGLDFEAKGRGRIVVELGFDISCDCCPLLPLTSFFEQEWQKGKEREQQNHHYLKTNKSQIQKNLIHVLTLIPNCWIYTVCRTPWVAASVCSYDERLCKPVCSTCLVRQFRRKPTKTEKGNFRLLQNRTGWNSPNETGFLKKKGAPLTGGSQKATHWGGVMLQRLSPHCLWNWTTVFQNAFQI